MYIHSSPPEFPLTADARGDFLGSNDEPIGPSVGPLFSVNMMLPPARRPGDSDR